MAEEIDCVCSNDLILLLPLPPLGEQDANTITTFPIDLIVVPNPDLQSGQITRFENANQNLYSTYSDTLEPVRIVVELPAKRVKASQKNGTACCGKTASGSGNEGLELTSRDINLNIQLLLDKTSRVGASVDSSSSELSDVNTALVGCKRCKGGCTNSCIAHCSKPRASLKKRPKQESKEVKKIEPESNTTLEVSHMDSLILIRRESQFISVEASKNEVENENSHVNRSCPCCDDK
ncbi:uncharacterized protein LOC143916531 isoform X2 [Arctopsyche grandis]|uniref:uncharacterized protein LOC143916531 isoform X2 n=1 Tax=Arctopsyche grandis TaxID=121162 RepID=UPI00406D68F0